MRKLSYIPIFSALGILFVLFVGTPNVLAAKLTTWQQFVKEECAGKSADAAEACAVNLESGLREACGAPKDTDKYKTCWRGFIRDNGGSAGPNSSPFEEEKSPELNNNTGTTPDGCAGIETSIIDCDETDGNPVVNMLLQIINFLAVGVGIAVVGGIIWGGLTYASSNGDSNKVQQAKMIIVNAVIGLLLFFFMYALINYLVPGGLFN